jgi:hypothetical protein
MTDPAPTRLESAREPARRTAVRAGLVGLAILLALGFLGGWVLPNVAGPTFLQVRALAAPRMSATGPTVVVDGRTPVRASSIDVGLEVVNRYPLSVVVGTGIDSYQAAAYHRDANGHLAMVWQLGVNDPTLEEGSDSPAGGGPGSGAAVIPSGTSRHNLSGSSTPFSLTNAAGKPLAAGVYYLRVWAYGIGSGLVPISIDGGVDALGTPQDPPAPPDATPSF